MDLSAAYHEFSPESRYRYSLEPRLFESHLLLCRGLPFTVTFDDGHRSQYEHAFPALERAGVRGHFFVTAGWTGRRPEYMTPPELRQLAQRGHVIGAHGFAHRFLPGCGTDELLEELLCARRRLEDCIGKPVTSLSLPHGAWDGPVLSACAEAGYAEVWGSSRWFPAEAARHGGGLALRGRVMVSRGTEPERLRQLLLGRGAGALVLWSRWAASRAGRGLLGTRGYHRLWCRVAGREESIAKTL